MAVREPADEELVDLFLKGDGKAFDLIVKRYREPIFRYCMRILHDEDEASDATQEVFLKVYGKVSGFRKMSSFKTWIYRIATNLCYNLLRRRKLFSPLEALRSKGYDQRILDRLVADQETAELRDAILRLPKKQKQVLLLRIYEELTFKQIADVLGKPEGTVKANFFHAMGSLRRFMGVNRA